MSVRRAVLWLHTAVQASFGIFGFVFVPGELFADVPTDPLAGLCLRLAAYTNVTVVVLVVGLLRRFRDEDTARLVAAALCAYHVLASIDGVRLAAGWLPVAMAEGRPSPLGMHLTLAVALGLAAGLPSRGPAR